jgi:hypothetical protein
MFTHGDVFNKRRGKIMRIYEVPAIPGEEEIAEFVRQFTAGELVALMTSRERGRILDRAPVSADCVIMEFVSRLVKGNVAGSRSAIHYAAYSPFELADFRQAILRRRAERKTAYLASLEDDWGGITGEEIPDESSWTPEPWMMEQARAERIDRQLVGMSADEVARFYGYNPEDDEEE